MIMRYALRRAPYLREPKGIGRRLIVEEGDARGEVRRDGEPARSVERVKRTSASLRGEGEGVFNKVGHAQDDRAAQGEHRGWEGRRALGIAQDENALAGGQAQDENTWAGGQAGRRGVRGGGAVR